MQERLQRVVDDLAAGQSVSAPIYSAALLVAAPDAPPFAGAAGEARPGEAMTAAHSFRIASISKAFTATVVLQLVEEGRLALRDRLADVLADVPSVDVENLSTIDGRAAGGDIEIEHLLRHRSGLVDFIFDERFLAVVIDEPTRQWSPSSLLAVYRRLALNEAAVGEPGERYRYSDFNYLLLAMVIEEVTGQSLAENYRDRIYTPLDLRDTYLEFYEPPRGDAARSYPYHLTVSTEAFNTSFDWGGGGLVSTLDDLNTFVRALVDGRLFRQASTLTSHALDFAPENDDRFALGSARSEYGMGLRRLSFPGFELVGHSGSWGCFAYYDRASGVSVVLTVNQDEAAVRQARALRAVLKILEDA